VRQHHADLVAFEQKRLATFYDIAGHTQPSEESSFASCESSLGFLDTAAHPDLTKKAPMKIFAALGYFMGATHH
jgi:hypothetical protein